tara:strand:+ start:226 stop:666 length:441 start_codon:yes stop_codon:yes gene_type:complete
MSDGFFSGFDGLPYLSNPVNSTATDVAPGVEAVTPLTVFVSTTPTQVSDGVRDLIVSRAKLTNKITEDLVKKYHQSFMCLFNDAKKTIDQLEEEIFILKNPGRSIVTTFDFKPKDIEVNPEMTQYIIQAMAEGVDLLSILPDNLLM